MKLTNREQTLIGVLLALLAALGSVRLVIIPSAARIIQANAQIMEYNARLREVDIETRAYGDIAKRMTEEVQRYNDESFFQKGLTASAVDIMLQSMAMEAGLTVTGCEISGPSLKSANVAIPPLEELTYPLKERRIRFQPDSEEEKETGGKAESGADEQKPELQNENTPKAEEDSLDDLIDSAKDNIKSGDTELDVDIGEMRRQENSSVFDGEAEEAIIKNDNESGYGGLENIEEGDIIIIPDAPPPLADDALADGSTFEYSNGSEGETLPVYEAVISVSGSLEDALNFIENVYYYNTSVVITGMEGSVYGDSFYGSFTAEVYYID